MRSAIRGQAALTIQRNLQDCGFDVYVYNSYETGNPEHCGASVAYAGRNEMYCKSKWSIKNPFEFLRATFLPGFGGVEIVLCGRNGVHCGRNGMYCGSRIESQYYPLVNKIPVEELNYIVSCGKSTAYCGLNKANCGSFDSIINTYVNYTIPSTSEAWPYFVYIAGQPFPTPAKVSITRKEEFENLCLKLCPEQDWIGIIVDYV